MSATTIRIGHNHEVFRGSGQYFDGDVPIARDVGIMINEAAQTLVLLTASQVVAEWPLADIRKVVDNSGDDMVLRLKGMGTERLLVSDPADVAILRARCPDLPRRAPFARRGRLVFWAASAVASVALMIFVLIPLLADQLADYLPPEGEKALGDTTLEQIRYALDERGINGVPVCSNPPGLASLDVIETRLRDGTPEAPDITLTVLDHPLINAFALPGGHVVLFDGLIQAAENAEQVTAVLAHEIGHIAARDPTRIAMRSAGSIGVLGLLFGDFAGGAVVLFLANRIIEADYTQEAEAAADAYAHEMLLAADLSPAAIGDFFEVVAPDGSDTDGTVFQHFLSHPEMGDRVQAARDAVPESAEFEELLSRLEWISLRQICN